MLEFINTSGFMQFLFDREDLAEKAGQIVEAILESRSPRLSKTSCGNHRKALSTRRGGTWNDTSVAGALWMRNSGTAAVVVALCIQTSAVTPMFSMNGRGGYMVERRMPPRSIIVHHRFSTIDANSSKVWAPQNRDCASVLNRPLKDSISRLSLAPPSAYEIRTSSFKSNRDVHR